MQIRNLLKDITFGLKISVIWVSSVTAVEAFHYGGRTEVLQPICSSSKAIWYGSFHMQVPSLAKDTTHWVVSGGTGFRKLLKPYFLWGPSISFARINHHHFQSYWLHPGIECWIPYFRLNVNAYVMLHGEDLIKANAPVAYTTNDCAFDARLLTTFFSSVRPFVGVFSTDQLDDIKNKSGHVLWVTYGMEWLISSQYTLEAQYNVGKGDLYLRMICHSVKVTHSLARNHVQYYLQEPLAQYTLPTQQLIVQHDLQKAPSVTPELKLQVPFADTATDATADTMRTHQRSLSDGESQPKYFSGHSSLSSIPLSDQKFVYELDSLSSSSSRGVRHTPKRPIIHQKNLPPLPKRGLSAPQKPTIVINTPNPMPRNSLLSPTGANTLRYYFSKDDDRLPSFTLPAQLEDRI